MLSICPECNLQISDKAVTCPHCGYPLKKRRNSSLQIRRLPNGFGRITKISNQSLRNPYRVMVTVGKTAEGRPIGKILKPKGYFRTYREAYEALVEYNKNPYDLKSDMTVEELYDKWSEQYFEKVSRSSKDSTKSAWNYCGTIKGMRVADLRARHIKGCMYEGEYKGRSPSPGTKTNIKTMFNMMLDYALEYELVDKNYARTFTIDDSVREEQEEQHKDHKVFSNEELQILWNSLDVPYVDIILIQCYTGWRPQELGLIELSDVDLDKNIMIGGLKTDSGKDRTVPIHSKIKSLVYMRYRNAKAIGSEYLLNCNNSTTHKYNHKLTYGKYRKRFANVIDQLGLDPDHKPHDGRKTFVTMAKNAKVDEFAIKYIVGHRINDLTERVYTERSIEWLIEEIEKIK